MNVLVTGSCGTIGSALMQRLWADGHDVTGIDVHDDGWTDVACENTKVVSLAHQDALMGLGGDYDAIVHLAANARVHELVKDASKAKENIDMTYNILEYARRENVDRFLFASSREVYGNGRQTIYAESETAVNECESPYAASKAAGEAMVDAYAECYDIRPTIIRFSNVYGRYDGSDRVIPLFISQARDDRTLTVYGETKMLDFTHIDDCISGIRKVLRIEKSVGKTFNIASGQGIPLKTVAEMIVKLENSSSDIVIEPSRTGEVDQYEANIERAISLLGYTPSVDIKEGIEGAVSWYSQDPEALPDPP